MATADGGNAFSTYDLPLGANSTDVFWEVDDVSLQTYAHNIVTWGGDREAPPAVRGANTSVPYVPGRSWARKTPDSRTMTLGMWVTGANDDGTIPTAGPQRELFEKNWRQLRRLLFQPRRQFVLRKRFRLYGDDTVYTAQALGEFAGGLSPTMTGQTRAAFTVDVLLADPYFYGEPIELDLDPQDPEQEFEILGDDRTMDITVSMTGHTKRLHVGNETEGVWFENSKELPTGQRTEIDVKDFIATHNIDGSPLAISTSITHSDDVDPYWFFLEPGMQKLGVGELDVPTQGVTWTNLFTNPSLETPSGVQQLIRTNLMKNSSFETAGSVVEVSRNNAPNPSMELSTIQAQRTNLATNPSFEGGASYQNLLFNPRGLHSTSSTMDGWFVGGVASGGSVGAASLVTSGGPTSDVVSYVHLPAQESAVGNPTGIMINTVGDFASVSPGAAITVSAYVRPSNAASATVAVGVDFYDGSGAYTSSQRSTPVAAAIGQWKRVSYTLTIPAGTAQVLFGVQATGIFSAHSDYLDVAGVMLVPVTSAAVPYTGAFFDGNTPGTSTTNYVWSGTVNNSPSYSQQIFTPLTNLFTNPSFETGATSNTSRRNLVENPKAASATTGYSTAFASGAATLASGTSGGGPVSGVTSYLSATWTTASSAGVNEVVYGGTGLLPVLNGSLYTASFYVSSSVAATLTAVVNWYNSAGTFISQSVGSATAVSAGSSWTRVSVANLTAPAGAVRSHVRIRVTTAVALGAVLKASALLLEPSQFLGSYFDGSFGTTTGFDTASWVGTANASASTYPGLGVKGLGASQGIGSDNPSVVVGQTNILDKYDTYSAMVQSVYAGGYVTISCNLLAGHTYTAVLGVYQSAVQGAVASSSRSLSFYDTANRQSAQLPDVAGYQVLRWTFTPVNDLTVIRYDPGYASSGATVPVYLDGLTIVEVPGTDFPYTGPFFDGATENTPTHNFAWTGTANDSTSTRTETGYTGIENLFENPRAAKAGTTDTLYTNLINNPSMETQATLPNQTLRTNFHKNPTYVNTTDWAVSAAGGGVYVATKGTATPPADLPTSSYYHTTMTTAPTSSPVSFRTNNIGLNGIPVTSGSAYSAAAYVRSSNALAAGARIDIAWYGSTGTLLSTTTGTASALLANTWSRKVISGVVAPVSAFYATVLVTYVTVNGIWTTASTQDITGVLFENAQAVGPYFDGSTTAAGTLTYAWSGTANASTSMQQLANAVLLRTNLVPNPNSSSVTGWASSGYGTGGAGSAALTTGAGEAGAWGFQQTWTTAATAGGTTLTAGLTGSGTIPVQPYNTISLSMALTVTQAVTTAMFEYQFYTDQNVAIGGATRSTGQSVAANTPTRLGVAAVSVPANAVWVSIGVRVDVLTGTTAGFKMTASRPLVENTSIIDSYFDGHTSDSGGRLYRFTDGLDASSSILIGSAAVDYTTQNAGCIVTQSTVWAKTGTKSLRITPTAFGNTSVNGAIVPPPAGGWQNGTTYTVLATCHLEAALTGSLDTNALTIWADNVNKSTAATNAPGSYDLSLTFVYSGSGNVHLAHGGAVGSGDVWWDNLAVVAGVGSIAYPGGYFDGSTTAPTDLTYGWTGTANASTSTLSGTRAKYIQPFSSASGVISNTWNGTAVRIITRGVSADSYVSLSIPGGFLPGQTYTIIATCHLEAAQTGTLNTNARRILADSVQSSQAPNTAGSSTELRVTFTPTTLTASVKLYNGAGVGSGDVYWSKIGVFAGTYTGAYFDALTGGTDEFSTGWAASPNDSRSFYQSARPFDVASNTDDVFAIQSALWAADGLQSLRLIPRSTAALSFASPGGDAGGLRLGMVAGQTYTLLATVRRSAAQTGSPDAKARSAVLGYKVGGVYSYLPSAQAPNTVGSTDIHFTFTVPAGATEAFIRLYNGAAAGGGDIWWDKFLLVQTPNDYSGGYFDGSTSSGDAALTYTWNGAPGASTSTLSASIPRAYYADQNLDVAQSSAFFAGGNYSLRVGMGPNTSTSGMVALAYEGESGPFYTGFATGKSYTFRAKRYLPSALSGSIVTSAADLVVRYTSPSAGGVVTLRSTPDTNTPGTVEKTLNVFIPGDATAVQAFLYFGGAAGSGVVYWDQIMLIPTVSTGAPYTGSYFDGSTPDDESTNYDWEGSTPSLGASHRGGTGLNTITAGSNAVGIFSHEPSALKDSGHTLRIIPTGTNDSYVKVGTTDLPMTAGHTYLLRGTITQVAAQVSPSSFARKIVVIWAGTALTPTFEQTVPNSIGQHEYVAVITTPSTGSLTETRFYNGDSVGGADVYWDAVLIGDGLDQSVPFFDGGLGTVGDFTYAWTGSADNSTSTMKGPGIASMVTSTAAAIIVSNTWVGYGAFSGRVMALTVSNNSYVSFVGDSGALRAGMTAGQSYTAMATIHQTGPQSGAPNAFARSLVAYYTVGGVTTSVQSNQAPNAAGDTVLRVSFTVPVGATAAWIRFYHGGVLGDPDIWIDETLLVLQETADHVYRGDYFDGSMDDTDYANYGWNGSPDVSTSYIKGLSSPDPVKITYRPAWF